MASMIIKRPLGFNVIANEGTKTIAAGFSSVQLTPPQGYELYKTAWLMSGYPRSSTIYVQGIVSDTGNMRVINNGSAWTGSVASFWLCRPN